MADRRIIVHGTLTAYNRDKCRCDLCRKAMRDYEREHRYGTGYKSPEYAYNFPFHFEWNGEKWTRVDD